MSALLFLWRRRRCLIFRVTFIQKVGVTNSYLIAMYSARIDFFCYMKVTLIRMLTLLL
jgi:hypothetical protein